MSIRKRLLLLVFAVWLPAAAGFGLMSWQTHEEQAAATKKQVEDYGLRVSSLLEREIDAHVVMARALASSIEAREGDFSRLHQQARNATAGLGSWVLVVDKNWQILNTKGPFPSERIPRGKALPLTEVQPAIVFVPHAPMAKTPAITVFVPVPGMSPQEYNVGISFEPERLQRILNANPGPFKALTSIVNSEQVVMARSRDPERWFGVPASERFKQRILDGELGFAMSTTLDGVLSLTYLSPPNAYGWSTVVSVPQADLSAAAEQATAKAVGAAAALLAFGFILALIGMGKIGGTVDELQQAANELGSNRVPVRLQTGVLEVDQVGAALHDAGVRAAEASQTLERKVQDARAEAEDAHSKLQQSQKLELIGRLTAGVAHDFNNLLQTISTAHHLLRRHAVDSQRQTLEAASRAVDKGRDLVKQLMTFGRVQTLEPMAVSIPDVVLKSQDLTRTAVGEAIVLKTSLEPSLPLVYVDPVQLEMALLNLVFNARDAMSAGGNITISAAEATSVETEHLGSGRFVRLDVADTGNGMTEAVRARAFEPYFTTKPVGAGSGIGLAQVHSFAKQSGGDIILVSELGVGTRITLLLPQADATATQADHQDDPAPVASGDPLRILMVEDDQLVSAMIASAFEEEGHSVTHCSTADEAVLVLQTGMAFELLFTDVVMPGKMNGVDLAKWCAAHRPEVAILVTTGFAENLEGVAAAVLQKPYGTEALFEALYKARQVISVRS